MERVAIALILLMVMAPAGADELIISGKTYHFQSNEKYNNDNFGLWYLRESSGVMAGVYENSYSDVAAAVAKLWRTGHQSDTFRAGVFLGAAVGYHHADIVPAAGIVLEAGPAKALVTPATATVALGVEF